MRFLRILRSVLLSLCGVVALVALLLWLLLGTSANKGIVLRLSGKYLENAELDFSKLRVSLYPRAGVELDSLVLVSHVGKGPRPDTVLRFSRFHTSADTRKLIKDKCIDIDSLCLDGLRVRARKFSDSTANYLVFKAGAGSEDAGGPLDADSRAGAGGTAKTGSRAGSGRIPPIRVGEISLGGGASIFYSSRPDTLFTFLKVDTLFLSANADSVGAQAAVNLGGRAFAMSPALGRLSLPFGVEGSLDYEFPSDGGAGSVELNPLRVNVANIPLLASGKVALLEGGALDMDASAEIEDCDLKELADVYVPLFVSGTKGLLSSGSLSASARAKGVLSQECKPRVALMLKAEAEVVGDSLVNFLPEDSDIALSGKIALKVDKPLEFASGARISVASDSLVFALDSTLSARMRGLGTEASLTFLRRDSASRPMPKVELDTKVGSMYVRSDDNRLFLRGLGIDASVLRIASARRRSLPRMAFAIRESLPDFLSEKDFEAADLTISLDSSVVRLLRDYFPSLTVSLKSAGISSPAFPLRTRVMGLEAQVNSNRANIKNVSVFSGRSDLSVSGSVSGYLPLLMGRKGLVDVDMNIVSRRLNVNEIVGALQVGAESDPVVGPVVAGAGSLDGSGRTSGSGELFEEGDEAFVVDSLEAVDAKMPLFVVPANVRADVRLRAGDVSFATVDVKPLSVELQMRQRTVRIKDARMDSEIGKIALDAFYSTRTKQNISVGADLAIADASAEGIIQLLPSVDDMLPMLKSFKGNMDAKVSATARLDTNMNILMPSVDGIFKISGKNLTIDDAGDLRKITKLLLFRNPNIGAIDDLEVGGVVHDNRAEIYPFVLGVDRYSIALSGVQGFDGEMDYSASILKSILPLRFGIELYGQTGDWKFKIGAPKYDADLTPVYSKQLDSVQVNLAESIRDVLQYGAEEVEKEARRARAKGGSEGGSGAGFGAGSEAGSEGGPGKGSEAGSGTGSGAGSEAGSGASRDSVALNEESLQKMLREALEKEN